MNLNRENFKNRAAFVGHALTEEEFSTFLIKERMNILGRKWSGKDEDPNFILWFQFPIFVSENEKAWMDFYVIPVYGSRFLASIKSGESFSWVEKVAIYAMNQSIKDEVNLTMGWGALTKNVTDHGAEFWKKHSELLKNEQLCSTHGDAGSVALLLRAMEEAHVPAGARIAVVGANGAIGVSITKQLGNFNPASVLLVGRPDRVGEMKNFKRLQKLGKEIDCQEILLHQDMHSACLDHDSDVVIVATNGVEQLDPAEIPGGALVLDVTAPPACRPNPDWEGHDILVLKAGCGCFQDKKVLPDGFGRIGNRQLWDVGAGGECVLWGCAGETIARAVFGKKGHLAGPDVPVSDVEWCQKHFPRMNFGPQPPDMFGKKLSWEEVRDFVARNIHS
mgnify:FL=1